MRLGGESVLARIKRFLSRNRKNTNNEINGITFIGSKRPQLEIGQGTYFNGAKIYCWDERMKITVGKYNSFADNLVIIAGGEHDKDWVSTYPFIDRWGIEELYPLKNQRFKGEINIGNDVWIASNVLMVSGVKIGNGAVIGAGAVVTKDVPPYAIVAGNPAQVIRYRFSEVVINKLETIQWWNWEEDVIKERLKEFPEPEKFAEKYYTECK